MNRNWPVLTVLSLTLALPCGALPPTLTSLTFSNAAALNPANLPAGYSVSLKAVAYGGYSNFVAVGTSSRALTATFAGNGLPWASNNVPASGLNLATVVSSNNTFVAGGDNTSVFSSGDGVNWLQRGNPFPNSAQVSALALNGGRYVAAGSFVEISYSDELTNWPGASIPNAQFLESFRGMAPVGTTEFAVCGIRGDIRVSSALGTTFAVESAFNSGSPDLNGIASDGGVNLICVGSGGTIMVSSNGGINWTNVSPSPAGTTNLNAVAYADPGFIVVGDSGIILVTTDNGTTWTSRPSPTTQNLSGVSFAATNQLANVAVLVGANGTVVIGGLTPPAPVDATVPVVNCAGHPDGTLSVTVANPTLTADWYDQAGNKLTNNSLTWVPTNTAPGSYTNFAASRDLRTGFSSTNRTPVPFIVNPLPTAVVSGSGTVCFGFPNLITATLGGSTGPWNVTWSDGVTQSGVGSPATRMVGPAVTTTYTVTAVADAVTGCTNTASGSAVVTVNPLPTAVVSGSGSFCPGFSNTITATLGGSPGPWNVTWSDGVAQNDVTSPATRLVGPAVTTTYTVTGLADRVTGCTNVGTGSATVTVNPLPAAPVSLGNQTNCAGVTNPPLAVSLSGVGVTADWFDAATAGNMVSNNTAAFVPTNRAPGTWTFFAQARNGVTSCINTNRTAVSLVLQTCTGALTVTNASPNQVVLTWFGNLELQSATNLASPINWTTLTTGTAGSTNNWTNSTIPPPTNNFFRLFAPTN